MRLFAIAGLAFAVTIFAPARADACACCADDGHRIEKQSGWTAHEKTELSRVRFAKPARVHRTDADDSVRGIDSQSGDYQVGVTQKRAKWSFAFKDSDGKSGTLVFSLPKNLDRFSVDLQDGTPLPGGGPLLYKEWRFTAPVTGTGIFATGLAKGGTARLVLQGRGSACDDVENFQHWMLVVSGPGAKYTLFGKLATPAASSP